MIVVPFSDICLPEKVLNSASSLFGSGLLGYFLAFIAAQDVKTVLLEVAADNVSALTLYHRHGFAEFGRRPSYYKRSGGACDAITMRRLSD